FARYSVDREWLVVPHFEKMLYDEALLVRAYLHAWQVTGHERFRQVVEETVAYLDRDLSHADGGWYSAEDADSEGVEGKFYVWSIEEVRDVLGADAEAAIEWYGVTAAGNFEGANILTRPVRGDLARPEPVERARRTLFEHRERRVRPGLDDKVLTEWNGLMLASLAEAGAATARPDWVERAEANATFLCDSLRRDDGRWLRSWQEGDADRGPRARHLAYAVDHAALVDGFTRLAEASGRARWIDEARSTADSMLDLFWDDDTGGLFTTGRDAEALVARQKDFMDNATPSANSLAALALLRLGALTGDGRYDEAARSILALFAPLAVSTPNAFGHLLAALDIAQRGLTEVVVVGDRPDLVEVVTSSYRPEVVLAWGEPYDSPLWEGRTGGNAYVCEHFACKQPVDTPEELRAQLDR
ncbi:MAG: thioredoxin domain-containing protein, partial [Actinomycetota bacterium]